MNNQALEDAIKTDLVTLSTHKFGMLSAREFYGSLMSFILKSSFALLLINVLVRLGLKEVGLYDSPISLGNIAMMWIGCFCVSFLMGLAFSQPLLMSRLLKGRLKTEKLLKKTYTYLCGVYFGLYTVSYTLITLFVNLGVPSNDTGLLNPWFIAFSTFFSQIFAFIFASGITGIISGTEFQRLGLGAVLNVISEMLAKARQHANHTPSTKDS